MSIVKLNKPAADISLKSTVNTDADVFTVGAAGGAVAVGASVALIQLSPTVRTYIGAVPGTAAANDGNKGDIQANNISIYNDIDSTAKSYAANVSGGAIALGGQVLLVFNRSDAYAGINRMNIAQAGDIVMDGDMNATGRAYLAQLAGGAVSVGMTTSYVLLDASNIVELDVTDSAVNARSVSMYTGRENRLNSSEAEALAVAGSAGAISVGLNSAVADNYTRNIARILGGTDAASNILNLTGALKIGAYGRATANAQVWGGSVGAVSVLGSAAVALLRSRQEAQVQGGNITAASLDAVSSLNKNLDNMDYVDASKVPGAGNIKEGELDSDSQKAAAFAGLISGNGAAIGVTANPAIAYGRAVSMAKIAPQSLMLQGQQPQRKERGHCKCALPEPEPGSGGHHGHSHG